MDTLNVISSPASAGGRSLCNSPAGPQLDLFGLEAALVSHSPLREKDSEPQTNGISGPSSPNSSAPASLQQSLANRLRARLGGNGSPEYSLTWKEWAISGQEPICALRASGHRISGNGCGGWPTPTCTEPDEQPEEKIARHKMLNERAKALGKSGPGPALSLGAAVHLSGWPTPGEDNANNAYGHKGTDYSDLPTTAQAAGWLTPPANEDAAGLPGSKMQAMLVSQCKLADLNGRDSGQPQSGTPAATAKPAALNPAFSRWLQGYPVGWCQAAIKAFRKMKRTPRQKPGSQG